MRMSARLCYVAMLQGKRQKLLPERPQLMSKRDFGAIDAEQQSNGRLYRHAEHPKALLIGLDIAIQG